MRGHVQVIAWLHIALGGLTLLGALTMFLFFGGLAALVASTGPSVGAPPLLALGGLGTFFLLFLGVLAIPQLILGWGLLNGAPWARVLGIVISILSLIHPAVGLGTALGVYGLVIFFNPETVEMFEGRRTRTY